MSQHNFESNSLFKMSGTEPTAPISSEPKIGASEVDMPLRDNNDSGSGVEEPPSKRARLEEPSTTAEDVRPRMKGVAPVKAEYVSIVQFQD